MGQPSSTHTLAHTIATLALADGSPPTTDARKAIALAQILQNRSGKLQTPQERRQQRELERMMGEAHDRATLMQLTDQAFRADAPKRVADQLIHILDVQGIPRFFSIFDRTMLKGFQSFGGYLPGVSIPMVRSKMREETANVVLPAESELLVRHLSKRKAGKLRMNVNYLGEALVGEDSARERLQMYLAAIQLPEIDCLSVKISTLYSQILPIAHDKTIRTLCDRVELLYRASAKSTVERPDGTITPKFIYLDMEEYRDLEITAEVFMQTLSRPGLENVAAGIALQAYLPDSYEMLKHLTKWAMQRTSRGGAPVTVRIVKGANMEAERVEASIAGWPQAPYQQKLDTDANYKRMLDFSICPNHVDSVRIGVASHNLFDVSYGLILADKHNVTDKIQFEMLEGIANHQRRALHELVDDVLLYAPATRKDDFVNAVGYLIRRLDENTGPENFLRHSFALTVGSEVWKRLEKDFVDSVARIPDTPTLPRRTQDRRKPIPPVSDKLLSTPDFDNEPDTDFTLLPNIDWAKQIIETWEPRFGDDAIRIPLIFAGQEFHEDAPSGACYDPSRPNTVVGTYSLATRPQIERALLCAKEDATNWRQLDPISRGKVLANVAHEIRSSRGDLMGVAMADAGKLLTESDPEVSEAIDFVEYYAATARDLYAIPTLKAAPIGVVVVVPPWNFPIAIPCGGIAAALAAGNTVILKPASNAVLTAYELCKCFWRAGISKEVLQFIPCSGSVGGAQLVNSELVDAVILTGGTDTALRMLDARPDMNLLAETGGKNATIVTAMSDREQAIKHVVSSAFGHSGQKCSATSLLILEAAVYDDETFHTSLCDAAHSLEVGSAWDVGTQLGPMISVPSGDLERAQKTLEDGETWALFPKQHGNNPNLWGPGIKKGVRPGSYSHITEFFGPVLSVLRATNLQHAIELANQSGYGLTSGLESLDVREQKTWLDQIRAGNLYINRETTGAIVLRQPFGGMGKSAVGPGIKAGGPNYVAQLMRFDELPSLVLTEQPLLLKEKTNIDSLYKAIDTFRIRDNTPGIQPDEWLRIQIAIQSYAHAFDHEFSLVHDHFRLVGQDNQRRYLPVPALRIRLHPADSAFDIFARACAGRIAGCHITVSSPPGMTSPALAFLDTATDSWGGAIEFVEETDADLAQAIQNGQCTRVRYAAPDRAPTEILRSVGDSGIYIARAPTLREGRIELLWYMIEQSISANYHRYGNLGERASEERKPVL